MQVTLTEKIESLKKIKSLQEFHLAETGFELAPSYSTCLEQLQSDTQKAIVN